MTVIGFEYDILTKYNTVFLGFEGVISASALVRLQWLVNQSLLKSEMLISVLFPNFVELLDLL
jgi:hypothetical protein